MNKEEFRTKAYPILLEALLRATNGDSVNVLTSTLMEKREAIDMLYEMLEPIKEYGMAYSSYIRISLYTNDGYNHTLEIV